MVTCFAKLLALFVGMLIIFFSFDKFATQLMKLIRTKKGQAGGSTDRAQEPEVCLKKKGVRILMKGKKKGGKKAPKKPKY